MEAISISEKLEKIRSALPAEVTLIAVSKTRSEAEIREAYNAGQRDFGENKIQEMCEKYEGLPKDIRWHMIGHVQTNKIKYMAPFVHLIHGCDREKVLREVNKEARKNNRIIDVLLQVHIAEEESKFGFDGAELDAFVRFYSAEGFAHIRIRGLMGMATFTENQNQVKLEFRNLKQHFDRIAALGLFTEFDTLSMGMSNDCALAIDAGSNMVRVGRSIFGER